MAAIRYKAKVGTDGTVILPKDLFAPGTEVEVLADTYAVYNGSARPALVRIVSYDPLVTEVMCIEEREKEKVFTKEDVGAYGQYL